MIGLPKKNAQEKPFFDYERLLFDTLQQYKHIWIKKATGLGITEFMLRYMAWLCLINNNLQGTQMCIVTGPRTDLAITLIDRMNRLFTDVMHLKVLEELERSIDNLARRLDRFDPVFSSSNRSSWGHWKGRRIIPLAE